MKGMFGKHNHSDKNTATEQPHIATQDLQSMNVQISELIEQNSYLLKEVQAMKETISVLKAEKDIH
jgi:hypothetical protein